MAYTKVVIVGGGFGGLNTAKSLKGAKLDILLIDKTNHHLFQPLLYQVATAALSPADIATPIREVFRGQSNFHVIMGDVVQIDKNKKEIVLGNGDRMNYDYLVLSVGASHSYFGNDPWEKFAPGLKTISDALKIREQVLISFERAERMDSLKEAAKYLNFVVIGGGPTGVEMAGAIAEIARKTMFKNFRNIHPEESKIYLVEAAPYILPVYPQKLSLKAKEDLENLGVCVIVGKKVTNVSEEGVQIEDQLIPCRNVIWAAGNQASPLLKTLDVPLDRQGRVIVDTELNIPGHPEIFVIGDAAQAMGPTASRSPASPPPRSSKEDMSPRSSKISLPKRNGPPSNTSDKGYMATIGKSKAVVVAGKLQFSGFIAWLAWCFIHVVNLVGFRNRLVVMMQLVFLFFLTGQRGARLIRFLDKEMTSQK